MSFLRLLLLTLLCCFGSLSFAQDPAALLSAMVGTWGVQQRMWPGPKAEPIMLPNALAQRRIVRGLYLEEVMQPADERPGDAAAFVRNALFNYNPVTSRFEYTSLDTRAPQLMVEQSAPGAAKKADAELKLQGGSFLAPEWGQAKNVRFTYRLTIGPISDDRQTVRLYLTPQTVLPKTEFLAFEYVYTKKP
jgi:hypothetical protein